MTDDDPPPDAASALAIVEREQARTGSALSPDLVLMHLIWGLAYLLGGVAYYLCRIGVLGGVTTVAVGVAIMVAAVATSAVTSVRRARGVHSATDTIGAMYGFGWPIALVLTGVLTIGAGGGLLAPVLFVFVVGLLYLFGGVVWTSMTQYGGGAAIMVVAVVAAFVPDPAHLLVLAIGAGRTLLVLGAVFAARR